MILLSEKREHYDAFAIPRNFGEDGISFNGLSRRNLVEGCILAVASGYPIVAYCPGELSLKIILLCFISLPLFFIGLVGHGGESLSQFLFTVLKFLLFRRKLKYYIDTGEPEPPKAKGIAWVKALFKRRDPIIKLRLERMGSAKLPLLRKGVVRWKETQMPYRFSPV